MYEYIKESRQASRQEGGKKGRKEERRVQIWNLCLYVMAILHEGCKGGSELVVASIENIAMQVDGGWWEQLRGLPAGLFK